MLEIILKDSNIDTDTHLGYVCIPIVHTVKYTWNKTESKIKANKYLFNNDRPKAGLFPPALILNVYKGGNRNRA